MILLESIIKTIKKENLLDRVARVGDYMLKHLMSMQKEHSDIISAVRGRGTFIAFNCASSEMRDNIIKKLAMRGRVVPQCKMAMLRISFMFSCYSCSY